MKNSQRNRQNRYSYLQTQVVMGKLVCIMLLALVRCDFDSSGNTSSQPVETVTIRQDIDETTKQEIIDATDRTDDSNASLLEGTQDFELDRHEVSDRESDHPDHLCDTDLTDQTQLETELELVWDVQQDIEDGDFVEETEFTGTLPSIDDLEITSDYIDGLCQWYCNTLLPMCNMPYEAMCKQDCVKNMQEDIGFIQYVACILAGDAWCHSADVCNQNWDTSPQCIEFCNNVEECPILKGLEFGFSYDDCLLVCSAAWYFYYETKDSSVAQWSLKCFEDAVKACEGEQFQVCIFGFPITSFCDELCSSMSYGDCKLPLDLFDSASECLQACQSINSVPPVILESCLSTVKDMEAGCQNKASKCFSSVLPPLGSFTYCKEYAKLCPLEKTVDVAYLDVCVMKVTGYALALNDELSLSSVFPGAIGCLSDFVECPDPVEGGEGIKYCLVPPDNEIIQFCETLVPCPESPFIAKPECRYSLYMLELSDAQLAADVFSCLESAGSCTSMIDCLPLWGQ